MKIKLPIKLAERTVIHTQNDIITGCYGYKDKHESQILAVYYPRNVNDGYTGYTFESSKYIPFSTEPAIDDNWMWVKLEGDYLVPADGPADREFALSKDSR